MATTKLRIACLIPSATDICVALGLGSNIVGVTHECSLNGIQEPSSIRILTKDGINTGASQKEIHSAVQASSSTCAKGVPSLYPIMEEEYRKAAPTVVFTQDLCHVCAPSSVGLEGLSTGTEKIISLSPASLATIAETFEIIADTCGIPEKGKALSTNFKEQMDAIRKAVSLSTDRKKKVFLFEWLDPPFDGGHWIPEMMRVAGLEPSITKTETKSSVVSWQDVKDSDPDIVFIACCGFGLDRNVQDAYKEKDSLKELRTAHSTGSIFATDGDMYFARPSQKVLIGITTMALCAYKNEPSVMAALADLPFVEEAKKASEALDLGSHVCEKKTDDIEDFFILHQRACENNENTYIDPETGYSVFTEVAHKMRGRCCGSGCRHCPYNHENVKNKTARIQQPAFLYEGEQDGLFAPKNRRTHVLFFSGGKDSFLAIRAMVREAKKDPFHLILMTTFDSSSRTIAHQEVKIDVVEKQARHLGISLVGVPLQRGSSETYVDRLKKTFLLIESKIEDRISSLVFGDLHLEHILQWRKEMLGKLGYELKFPLLNVDYNELEHDLEASGVRCVVSASTVDSVQVGDVYDHEFRNKIKGQIDRFGENGEFHTEIQVWTVDKATALGL